MSIGPGQGRRRDADRLRLGPGRSPEVVGYRQSWIQRELTVGQHPALGGDGSGPCPGELVTMALAACMDGTVRGIADLMEIELDRIRVEVVNRGDVREMLRNQRRGHPGTHRDHDDD